MITCLNAISGPEHFYIPCSIQLVTTPRPMPHAQANSNHKTLIVPK